MQPDRRKERKGTVDGRRYDDVKEASATAAERIAKATEDVCRAIRQMQSDVTEKAA